LTALDMQDLLNNLAAGGAEATEVSGQRVVTGVPVIEVSDGVSVGGVVLSPPWRISVIGDTARLTDVADVMTQQLRADRRVRTATYEARPEVVIRSVVTEKPFVYAVA
jgi:uncharacterized protein YlxW (UPF0749 family)